MKKSKSSLKDSSFEAEPTEFQADLPEKSEQKSIPVVGIGASAGGFHAVRELLAQLPADAGMALVLIQHLKAEHESNLPELLSKSTSLPVRMATNDTEVQPGQVYILPPGRIMEIESHRLKLFPREGHAGNFRPIDHFFDSLGRDCTEAAIAVVLSGSGSDGAAGIRVVKANGGIVLAQDEVSAEFTDMPRHAVATGMVDFVLEPQQIAQKLVELCRHPYLRGVAFSSDGRREEPELEAFYAILQSLRGAGVDFTQYKQSTVRRRISRRMALHKIQSSAEYAGFLHEHPEEVVALKEDMLIKVTTFFRDPEVFDTLRKEVFPELVRKKNHEHPLRVWVPGCATGEEVYSLAMCLLDFMAGKNLNLPVQIFGTDLSETANEELDRSHDDLQNLLLSAEIPFIIVTQDLRIRRTSPHADKIFNLRTDDVGRSLSEIRFAFDVPDLEELIRQVLVSTQSVEREVVDREGLWKLLRIRPYRTAESRIRGAVITLIDIDRLKRSLDEIENAHKYALRIVDTIKFPLLVLDGDLRVTTANPAFYEHFKVNPKETEGQSIYQLGAGQWDHHELRSLLEEILPKSTQMDNFLVHFDFPRLGERSMLLSARKMYSSEKRPESILLSIEDVTQRMKMKEDLHEAKRRAEDASRAKSEFLATMSHEIRTPMTVVLGVVQQLLESDPAPEQISYLNMAKASADALTDLLNDILDFSRIEAQRMILEHISFKLREVAESSVDILRGEARRKGLDLSLKISATVPELLIGDPIRLWQVLVNLISNAIKFTEQGSVSVELDSSTDDFDRKMVRFAVSDTGIGIPADKLNQLFTRFQQIDSSNTRKYGGTGLGLAICKGIVERMDGTIWATSKKDRGSIFSFSIPMLSIDESKAFESSAKENPPEKSSGSEKTKIKPPRILIVEDEAPIRQLIKMFLDSHDWQSVSAAGGKEALQYLEQEAFDLVLVDVQMPEMDGMQLAKAIREKEQPTGRHLPLVALTAHADEKYRENCLAAGMDDYLSKPFSKDGLFAVIERHL